MVQKGKQKGYAEFGKIEIIKIYLRLGEKMKKLLLLVICFMFVGVGSVSAQTETNILYKKHTFELGGEISYITYKEPGVLRERGAMYGGVGSYTYHNKIMLKVEGRGCFGKLNYYDLEGPPVPRNSNRDYVFEARGLGGYDFSILKSSILTPFLGVGYRHFNDDVLPRPYERVSNYLYSPIGMAFITGLGNDWSIGGTGEYDYFWWGNQNSHPIEAVEIEDIESRLKDAFGLRGSITLEKKYKKVIFEGGPFIRYWDVKKLEPVSLNVGLPIQPSWISKNDSTEVGFKLAVKF
jgi:hypothetical protein